MFPVHRDLKSSKITFFEITGICTIPFGKVLYLGPKILDVKGYPFTPLFLEVCFLLVYFVKVFKKGSPKNGGLTLYPFRPVLSKKRSIFRDFWQNFFHFSKNDVFGDFPEMRVEKKTKKTVFFFWKPTSILHMTRSSKYHIFERSMHYSLGNQTWIRQISPVCATKLVKKTANFERRMHFSLQKRSWFCRISPVCATKVAQKTTSSDLCLQCEGTTASGAWCHGKISTSWTELYVVSTQVLWRKIQRQTSAILLEIYDLCSIIPTEKSRSPSRAVTTPL